MPRMAAQFGVRVEVAQAFGVADFILAGSAGPLGIGENIDVRFRAVAYGYGFLIHLHILVGLILEVQHPVVQQVFLALRNQQMGFYHELRVQADEDLCVIHGLPPGVIHGVHHNLIQLGGVHARLASNAACGGVTARDGTVVEQQYLCIRLQAELLAAVYGHISHNRAGGVFGHVVCLPEGVNLHDVLP